MTCRPARTGWQSNLQNKLRVLTASKAIWDISDTTISVVWISRCILSLPKSQKALVWHDFERILVLLDTELPWSLIIRESHKKCKMSMSQPLSERQTHIAGMGKRVLGPTH